ncbi:MAG TPA: RNA polymerase sigma-70 factor [Thermoanaerobaculia bacterium]
MSDFETHRPLLFSIAYRMTGSAADAEDLVQDAYVRFASSAQDEIRDVKAFLITVVTRLALDRLKSAQHRRETYVGPWLPEPVLTGIDGDPYARVTRDEKVELALLRTLERLSPQERAVLLLYEVLDHDHNEIAAILNITSASSRQILHRAKERVAEEKQRFAPPVEEQRMLIEQFMHALAASDVDGLRQVLAADVVSIGDGGGKAFASKRPLHGFDMVSRLFLGLMEKYSAGVTYDIEEVNGAPGLVLRRGDVIETVLTFTFENGRMSELAAIVNPDKLTFATRQSRASHRPPP